MKKKKKYASQTLHTNMYPDVHMICSSIWKMLINNHKLTKDRSGNRFNSVKTFNFFKTGTISISLSASGNKSLN